LRNIYLKNTVVDLKYRLILHLKKDGKTENKEIIMMHQLKNHYKSFKNWKI